MDTPFSATARVPRPASLVPDPGATQLEGGNEFGAVVTWDDSELLLGSVVSQSRDVIDPEPYECPTETCDPPPVIMRSRTLQSWASDGPSTCPTWES